MNPSPENDNPHAAGVGASPANWREALTTLIATRVALIQHEARESARSGAKRFARLIAAVLCLFFTWALVLVGGVAALCATTGWPWHWVTLAAAALHLLAAFLLLSGSKPAGPSFPLTRAEFQKDREWFENLHHKPKSSN